MKDNFFKIYHMDLEKKLQISKDFMKVTLKMDKKMVKAQLNFITAKCIKVTLKIIILKVKGCFKIIEQAIMECGRIIKNMVMEFTLSKMEIGMKGSINMTKRMGQVTITSMMERELRGNGKKAFFKKYQRNN